MIRDVKLCTSPPTLSRSVMRAVVTLAHGGREQLHYTDSYADPVPAADEVLLRIAACAVNYHDIFTRRGMPGIKIPLPVIVGSDIAGVVAALGADVSSWRIGDRVLLDPILRAPGRNGMIGEVCDGGRAELIAVPAQQLVRVPDTVTLDQAASLPLAYGTAHRMMYTRGRVRAGERVLVLGASGGVGVACVQLAKLAGAEVVACASTDEKLARLRTIGADHALNYTTRPFAESVRELFGKPRISGGGGVDVVVNFTGGDTWEPSQRCLRVGGRVLTCGATAGYAVQTDMRYLWTYEQELIGSNGWTVDDLHGLLALIADGRLDPVIDRRFALEDAAEAERLLEDREVLGKVLITP
jgi:alcohol dehydrogenase